jgi:ribosomal-protein-alanine N-acetyltransferase
MNIQLRPMKEADLSQLVYIENRWSYLSKWGEEGYRRILQDPRIYVPLVAEDTEPEGQNPTPTVVGLAVLALLIDHCELCNLVVLPEYIARKVGYRLLQECIEVSRSFGILNMFLEVRASNNRAIDFYKANGFEVVSRRRNYYRNPSEDAWVMQRKDLSLSHAGTGVRD